MRRLSYLNQFASDWLGEESRNVLHQPLREVLPELDEQLAQTDWSSAGQPVPLRFRLPAASGTEVECDATAKPIAFADESQLMVCFVPAASSTAKEGEALPGNRPLQGRLHQLELMISGMWSLLQEEGSQQLRLLNRLPPEMDELQEELPSASREHAIRATLVETLQLTVRAWEQTTGKTEIELAEESGLWTLSYNQDGGAYARTLDKYLSLERLPQHPRWRKVLQTAYYVLRHGSLDSDLRARLTARVEKLEVLLRQAFHYSKIH